MQQEHEPDQAEKSGQNADEQPIMRPTQLQQSVTAHAESGSMLMRRCVWMH